MSPKITDGENGLRKDGFMLFSTQLATENGRREPVKAEHGSVQPGPREPGGQVTERERLPDGGRFVAGDRTYDACLRLQAASVGQQ